MFGIFFLTACSVSKKHYPELPSNTVASEHYEIKKLIDGEIEAVLFDNVSGNTLVYAGHYLWKINPQGVLVDTFEYWSFDDSMSSSGIIFKEDYYIDWVFSGDKNKKKYSEHIDTNALSEPEFIAQLDRGQRLDFRLGGKDEELGIAYVHAGDRAWTLDISRRIKRIDEYCRKSDRTFADLRWRETCLKDYARETHGLTVAEGFGKGIDSVGFRRETYFSFHGYFEMAFGALASVFSSSVHVSWPTWWGTGYFELKHNNEVLKFNALAEEGEIKNTAIYDSPHLQALGSRIITAKPFNQYYSENKFNSSFKKNIGLYALRKKASVTGNTALISRNSWYPSFSGMPSFCPLWGNIGFWESSRAPYFYWLNHSSSKRRWRGIPPMSKVTAVVQPLQDIPKTLSFTWVHKEKNEAFRVQLPKGEVASFYKENEYAQVMIDMEFDQVEISAAFKQLNKSPEPIQLALAMNGQGQDGHFSLSLTNGKETIPLDKTLFRMDKLP